MRFYSDLSLLVGGPSTFTEGQRKSVSTPHEKAYHVDPSIVAHVQPGLVIGIVSSKVASDGTISVDHNLTDPTGAHLDRSGAIMPGPISLSFLAAYIPKGQEQYRSYIMRTATAPSGATSMQAAADGGRYRANRLDGRVRLRI